ncbi:MULTISPECIES: 16S rRNA (uracil(1498)-N(3))-methyltransferase [unclassified Corynebacterium]|uniref:16S rRNA (uracil(1498)-N(3))-methyltransferase n=1 Tax=unclassified Corynebacterium TaxID=2624378 RepID=UPI0030956829
MTLPVFLIDFTELPEVGATVTIDGPEAKHIGVRRLGIGELIGLTNGADGYLEAEIRSIAGSGNSMTVACDVAVSSIAQRPGPHVTVVQALPKSDRAELAVDLMTEVGVDCIIPWSARNCVAKWVGNKQEKARQKWAHSAREAAKQARRAWIPPVLELHDTHGVVKRAQECIAGGGMVAVLHESASAPFAEFAAQARDCDEVMFIVGPEGGVDPTEVEQFAEIGAHTLVLGPTVLRTALAGASAISALGPLTNRWP